jgi:galactose mutarotase-like enzyme
MTTVQDGDAAARMLDRHRAFWYLSSRVIGKGGLRYVKYGGFTFETQKFPGSPNCSHFPTTELLPGETHRHRMVFDFSTTQARRSAADGQLQPTREEIPQ